MDFGALPPEINSARMYSGPGPGTMLAAGVAWDQLATELRLAATHYGSVVSDLTTGPWRGSSSVSMAAAAASQVGWLNAVAAQAEETAGQAWAAVSAYEAALGMTVPPPVVAANRAQLMSLVATNFLGQNTPAIAATEAHYAQMWAQDAAAMYTYAGASAAATRLSPFTGPPQAVAVSQAAALPRLLSSVPTVLQTLASPLASSENPLLETGYMLEAMMAISSSTSIASSLTGMVRVATMPAGLVTNAASSLGSALQGGLAGAAAGSANLGRAASLGALSVPPSWAMNAAPVIGPAAPLGGGVESATGLGAFAPGGLLGGLPLAMRARNVRGGPRIEQGRSVIPRTVFAG